LHKGFHGLEYIRIKILLSGKTPEGKARALVNLKQFKVKPE
jgi:hypothetical protein